MSDSSSSSSDESTMYPKQKKQKYKGKDKKLLDLYLSHKESKSKESSRTQEPTKIKTHTTLALPNEYPVEKLMDDLAKERKWENISSDLDIFRVNRIRTVGDLRLLSKGSWKEIKLLPIVKDLLRERIKSKLMVTSNQTSNTDTTLTSTIDSKPTTIKIEYDDNRAKEEEEEEYEEEPLKLDNIKVLTENSKTEVREGFGSIEIGSSPDRIKITTKDGRVFEADRYCPHKKVDLAMKGYIKGDERPILVCPKHDWEFDLSNGGVCVNLDCLKNGKYLQEFKGSTINALQW